MLDPRLLCALDEAGNVAALELLPEWATTGRGQGIQLVSVWHDQAQLVHRYGDRAAATILNGHWAKVLLSGLADVGALEPGSRLIGDQAVTETNYSTNPTGRVAASQATSYRPLVPGRSCGDCSRARGSSSTAICDRPASRSAPTSPAVSSAGANGWHVAPLTSRSDRPVRATASSSGPPGDTPARKTG